MFRNPTGSQAVGVWCYTTTSYVRWEKCNVPLCEDNVIEDPTTTTTTAAIPVQNDAVSTNEPGLQTMTL